MGVCPKCLIAVTDAADGDSGKAQAFEPPTPEDLAKQFPQLEIIELIGRGGMGAVYKARQKELDRVVALKILPPSIGTDPAFAERFTREARTLAKLNHPNIVTLYESGCADGLYYFLMEFIDGVNLREAMSAGQFTPEEALAIVPPVCEALQLAHSHGIVHRDIKPENLLLNKDGRIKIADFGVAKLIGERNATIPPTTDESSGETEVHPSLPVGTPRYMAPEQTENPTRADHRVDIFALGAVLYELLTEESPKDNVMPPSKLVQVDVKIDEIVLRALDKRPEMRFPTAAEFRAQVETFTSESSSAASTEGHGTSPTENHPHSTLLIGLALFFAGLSGLLGAATFFMMPDTPSIFIWSIPAAALLGFCLAIPVRQTNLGRRAFFGAGINAMIWVAVATVFDSSIGFLCLVGTAFIAIFATRQGIAPAWKIGVVALTIMALALCILRLNTLQKGSEVHFPDSQHISRDGSSVLIHHHGSDLDYALHYDGEFDFSSASSRNRHSLTWIENYSIHLLGIDQTFGFLRESVSPLFLTINGKKYDLREGKIFVLKDSGQVEHLPLTPSIGAALSPKALGEIILNFQKSAHVFGPVIERELTLDEPAESDERDERDERGLKSFLDLDTGEVANPSVRMARQVKLRQDDLTGLSPYWVEVSSWMRANGTDVAIVEATPPKLVQDGGFAAILTNLTTGKTFASIDQVSPKTLIQWKHELSKWKREQREANHHHSENNQTWYFKPNRVSAFTTREGGIGVLEISDVQAKTVTVRYKLLQSSLTAKRLIFEPTRGMENKTSWSVFDKPSHLNPDGWAVYSRMTLGGKAMIEFPGEAARRCEITLVEGDDEGITLRIDDLIRKNTMTLSLIRNRPGEVTIDGVGYRLLYMEVSVSPNDPSTGPFAHVIMTPAGQPKSKTSNEEQEHDLYVSLVQETEKRTREEIYSQMRERYGQHYAVHEMNLMDVGEEEFLHLGVYLVRGDMKEELGVTSLRRESYRNKVLVAVAITDGNIKIERWGNDGYTGNSWTLKGVARKECESLNWPSQPPFIKMKERGRTNILGTTRGGWTVMVELWKYKPKMKSIQPKAETFTIKHLAGDYYRGNGLSLNVSVQLSENGKYAASWDGCVLEIGAATGTWSVKGNVITLNPTKLSETVFGATSRKEHLRKLTVQRESDGAFVLLPVFKTDYGRAYFEEHGITRETVFQKPVPDLKHFRIFSHEDIQRLIQDRR